MTKEIRITFNQLLALYQNQSIQLENLRQNISSLSSLLLETDMASEALKALNKPGKDEILFSLGAGIFIDATVGDLKKIKTNIGGNIIEEMTVSRALERLEKRKKSILNNIAKMREQEKQMVANLIEMEKVIQQIEQQRQSAKPPKAETVEKSEETTPSVY